jgi:hypothetical protein
MVGGAEIKGIVRHFEDIDDLRSQVNRLHLLVSQREPMDHWPLQDGRMRVSNG